MKRTLSALLVLCLLTALLPISQAEAPDEVIALAQDAADSSDPVAEAAEDLFAGEIPEPDEATAPAEAPSAAARYARLLSDAAVYQGGEPMGTLPADSLVLVVDAASMKVAFATENGPVEGYVDADSVALLSDGETAAMLDELLAGRVLLYEDDLDRPLPWAEPVAVEETAAEEPDSADAAPETDSATEEAPTEETPAEETPVEEDVIEAVPVEAAPEDEAAQAESDGEAPADEGDTDEAAEGLLPEPEETAEEPFVLDDETLASIESTEVTVETAIDSSLSSGELFEGYANRILYSSSRSSLKTNATTNAGAQLTGQNLTIYNALKPEILKIAAGSRSSTVLSVPVSTVLGKTVFTSAEVTSLLTSGIYSFDINVISQALWLDCTYELYWFDRYQYNVSASWPSYPFTADGGSYTVEGRTIVFNFSVLSQYRLNGNRLAVDTSLIQGAKTAAENAKAIVKKYAGYSDYVKLFGYAVEICNLVDYNHAAAAGELDKSVQDPWKLIWVFDGNKSTDVVCEGYAQAFQYLCELTDFNDGIRCILVTGNADGVSHSWNVVRMDDGKNYLVDVTWMDSEWELANLSGNMADWISAEKGRLFLCGAASGSVSGGYTVNYRDGGVTTRRVYWDATLKAYTTSSLTLAADKYVLTGFQRVGSSTYFFDSDGHYVTGAQQLNGLYLEFDSQGRLQGTLSGWQTVNGKRYFFESGGLLHTTHTVVADKAVAATCTEPGKTAGTHCSVCGTILTAQTTIPATGHTVVTDAAVAATCTEPGKTAGSHCSVCNAVIAAQTVIPATGHTVVVDAGVAATATNSGKTEGSHCSVCGTVLTAQETVPSLGFHMKKSTTAKVNLGESFRIYVDGKKVKSYKSGSKKIATVSSKGVVKAKKAGTAKITITLKNKKKLTLTVKVVDPYAPKSVKITNGKKATLKKGKKLTLKTSLTPSNAKTTLKWSTSNKKVATVSSKGVVTAKKKGKAKITVKTANGKKATITITVK